MLPAPMCLSWDVAEDGMQKSRARRRDVTVRSRLLGGVPVVRIGLGIVLLWFGALEFMSPDLGPAHDLSTRTIKGSRVRGRERLVAGQPPDVQLSKNGQMIRLYDSTVRVEPERLPFSTRNA
jgi:hypothetical protein